VPCVTKWQYPLTDQNLYMPDEYYTWRCSKFYLSFKPVYELSMFYVKPTGNAVKYDESHRKGAKGQVRDLGDIWGRWGGTQMHLHHPVRRRSVCAHKAAMRRCASFGRVCWVSPWRPPRRPTW
jgi:hypothetical protein